MAQRPHEKERPPEAELPKQPRWRHDLFWAALLLIAVVLAYQPVWQAGFIWDDDNHLTANPVIVGPLGLRDIWTTSAAFYYPLTLTTFWIEHALWGLAPLPYHLVNVLLHGACALLLWRLLLRLEIRSAWLGAALWALHPVQVESAAWITELKNTQSGLFYLLAILFFLNWRDAVPTTPRRNLHYVLALLCAALALLSKSSTVMLPVVLALCLWWRRERWTWREVAWLVPFLCISAAVSSWTIWEQKFHSGALGTQWSLSWPQRIIVAGDDIWFYLEKLAWPHPLIFIYPRWDIEASQATAYLPALAAAGALGWLGWLRNGALRPVFFALVYFVISLFPVLGFFNVYFFRYSFVADHFQYLASMGPLALAGAGISTAFHWLKKTNRWLEAATCGALLVTLGILSWSQCRIYRDIETLWRTTIAQNPGCLMARNNLGLALADTNRVPEAIAQFEQLLQIDPDYTEAHYNLGRILLQTGETAKAMDQLETALRIKPDYFEAHTNLGNALLKTGRVTEAITQYETAIKINPNYAVAHNDLSVVLLQQDRVPEAVEQSEIALHIDPVYVEAHDNLGHGLFLENRFQEAIEQFKAAIEAKPDYDSAHLDLGTVLLQTGRVAEALEQFKIALQINPRYAEAYYDLGNALFQTGQVAEAIDQYKQALRINPDYAEAHNNLGSAFGQTGRTSDAVEQFEEALRIDPHNAAARDNLARLQVQLKTAPAKP